MPKSGGNKSRTLLFVRATRMHLLQNHKQLYTFALLTGLSDLNPSETPRLVHVIQEQALLSEQNSIFCFFVFEDVTLAVQLNQKCFHSKNANI